MLGHWLVPGAGDTFGELLPPTRVPSLAINLLAMDCSLFISLFLFFYFSFILSFVLFFILFFFISLFFFFSSSFFLSYFFLFVLLFLIVFCVFFLGLLCFFMFDNINIDGINDFEFLYINKFKYNII